MYKKIPIYQQLAELLREKIEKGEYAFGSSLPSEREIAETYELNRMTVRKALDLLEKEGLLVRIQGKGTFINTPKIDTRLDTIQSLGKFLTQMGVSVTNRVLYCGRRKADYKFSKIFGVSPEDEIYQIFRLRLGNGEPFALEYSYVPFAYINDCEQYDFKVYSLYDLYDKHGIVLMEDHQQLEIVTVHNPQAKLLDLPEGGQVFMLTNVSIDKDGRVIEYTRSYHSSKKFSFSTIMS